MIISIEDFKQFVARQTSKVALTSMPGDPIHSGHISCLQACKAKFNDGTIVACIVNDDTFLVNKKGHAFMPLQDRCEVIDNIKDGADYVIPFHPSDATDMTVCEAIRILRPAYFLKGGDRTADETLPEWSACQEVGCKILDHIGAGKVWSSSNYLQQHKDFVLNFGKVQKPWGWYRTLFSPSTCAVKELHVKPGEELSLQLHKNREETWLVVAGEPDIIIGKDRFTAKPGDVVSIPKETLHRIENNGDCEAIISEWWLGNSSESDIERFEDKYGR